MRVCIVLAAPRWHIWHVLCRVVSCTGPEGPRNCLWCHVFLLGGGLQGMARLAGDIGLGPQDLDLLYSKVCTALGLDFRVQEGSETEIKRE
jgi:hypothetical protein